MKRTRHHQHVQVPYSISFPYKLGRSLVRWAAALGVIYLDEVYLH